MGKLYVTKEQGDIAKKYDALTYLMNYYPEELVRKSKDTYSTKTHDSVVLNNGFFYRNATGKGGVSAVDYLIYVCGYSYPEAVTEILNKTNENVPTIYHQPVKVPIKNVLVPKKASNNDKVIDYLMNRGIDESIINYCIINNLLYQEKTTDNVVFLGYDENHNIKYAGCRATNSSRIMRDAKGSSKAYSFRIIGNKENHSIHLFESSIDLLSYATLMHNRGYDWKGQNFIALAGVYQTKVNIEDSKLPIAVEKYLDNNKEVEEIILHFDNDTAGRNAAKAFQFILKEKYKVRNMPAPYGKDINDYLCYKLGLKSYENDIRATTFDGVKLRQESERGMTTFVK